MRPGQQGKELGRERIDGDDLVGAELDNPRGVFKTLTDFQQRLMRLDQPAVQIGELLFQFLLFILGNAKLRKEGAPEAAAGNEMPRSVPQRGKVERRNHALESSELGSRPSQQGLAVRIEKVPIR